MTTLLQTFKLSQNFMYATCCMRQLIDISNGNKRFYYNLARLQSFYEQPTNDKKQQSSRGISYCKLTSFGVYAGHGTKAEEQSQTRRLSGSFLHWSRPITGLLCHDHLAPSCLKPLRPIRCLRLFTLRKLPSARPICDVRDMVNDDVAVLNFGLYLQHLPSFIIHSYSITRYLSKNYRTVKMGKQKKRHSPELTQYSSAGYACLTQRSACTLVSTQYNKEFLGLHTQRALGMKVPQFGPGPLVALGKWVWGTKR